MARGWRFVRSGPASWPVAGGREIYHKVKEVPGGDGWEVGDFVRASA